jgi:hypothetical protein
VTRSVGPLLWGLVLVAVGVLFLVQELSNGSFDAGQFIGKTWPVVLLALGAVLLVGALRGRAREGGAQRWSAGLDGLSRAAIRIEFGAGSLYVGPGPAGKLADGTFEGGVRAEVHDGQVRLRPDMDAAGWWWPFSNGRAREWRVALTAEIPLSLRIEGGASRNELDLAELMVTDLEVRTGASESRIRLPRSGVTRVRLDAGAASVRITVPDGVLARVRGRLSLGSVDVDTDRFPPTGDGWMSPAFEGAPSRADIEVSGGVGSLRVD